MTCLNRALDRTAIRRQFALADRVQICDFLDAAFAEALARELGAQVDWRFAIRQGGEDTVYAGAEWEAISLSERQRILTAANRQAATGFQYMFDYCGLVSARSQEGRLPPALSRLTDFIRSDEFATFLRAVTGLDDIASADAQATRYRAGQYLSRHDDLSDPLRRAAYVLGLTRAWRADWGGLLLFHDSSGDIAEGWSPKFNTLSLFSVPQVHSVSFVTPAAAAYRHSVTGWALADPST